jgi:hypothetical protein
MDDSTPIYDELKPHDGWWTVVEREEGVRQHSGEVEMKDGGRSAMVESAVGARSQ